MQIDNDVPLPDAWLAQSDYERGKQCGEMVKRKYDPDTVRSYLRSESRNAFVWSDDFSRGFVEGLGGFIVDIDLTQFEDDIPFKSDLKRFQPVRHFGELERKAWEAAQPKPANPWIGRKAPDEA